MQQNVRVFVTTLLAAVVLASISAATASAKFVVRPSAGDEGTGRIVFDQDGTVPSGLTVSIDLLASNSWGVSFDATSDGLSVNDGALVEVDPALTGVCTVDTSGDPNGSNGKLGYNRVVCDMTVNLAFTATAKPLFYLGDGTTSGTNVSEGMIPVGVEIRGEKGDDVISGGKGPDRLDGGTGNDEITGYEGDDVLVGGPGNDTTYGDDTFGNGGGNDTIDVRDGEFDVWTICGTGTDTVTADAASIEADSHFNDCDTVNRPAVTPSPGPSGTTIDGVVFASPLQKAPDLVASQVAAPIAARSIAMPDYQRPFKSKPKECTAKSGAHVFCDVNAVRANLVAQDVNATFVVRADASADKNDGWAPGEVTRTQPVAGAKVKTSIAGPQKVVVYFYDPATPPALQNCRAGQRMTASSDTTLGQYLVGKDYATVKKELLEFDCYDKAGKGVDEKNAKYAIETVTDAKAKYPRVTKVADKKVDGERFTTLIVTMAYPPSNLHLSWSSATKPGLTMNGELRVDAKATQALDVRVYGATGWIPPAGTEVTLRDPDGELVDRGVTDKLGAVKLSGTVVEAGKHELFASVGDRDGDAISGYANLNAVRSTSGETFGRSAVARAARGAKRQSRLAYKSACVDVTIPDDAGSLAVRKQAVDTYCRIGVHDFVTFGINAAVRSGKVLDPKATAAVVADASARDAAVSSLLAYATGKTPQVTVTPMFFASGNADGKVNVADAKFVTTPVLATDGTVISAVSVNNALDARDGTVSFRVPSIGATFLPNGAVIWDLVPTTVSKDRVITDANALTSATSSVVNLAVLLKSDPAKIIAAGGGNVIAAGAGNIIAGGAGNIVAGGAGNIVAGGAGNAQPGGPDKFIVAGPPSIVAGGAGNIVAGGAGNIVAGGAGNIVAGGAGNVMAKGAVQVIASNPGILAGAKQGSIVAGGAGN